MTDDAQGGWFVLCEVGELTCALPLASIRETMRPLPIASLSGLPPLVRGVAPVRGVPVPLMDVAAACLLTGMGRDGALGLLDIRQSGGFTIAQDESTCVVYGIPREAVLLHAAEKVLPLDALRRDLEKVVADTEGEGRC